MSTPENCGAYGQQLVDLMSCFAQNMGQQTASYVSTKINEVVNLNDVDLTELHNQITLIMGELAENEVVDGDQTTALNGILTAITNLQTSVANNSTSITQVQNALSSAVSALEASIAAERAYVDSEIERVIGLIPTVHAPYDDTEVRELIQANLTAIGSESATRAQEIARVEGLIAANAASIEEVKVSLAANAAKIATLETTVSDLTATVAANKAATDAKFVAIDACMNGFFSALDGASCETIGNAFALGLSNGNNGQGNAGAL